MFGTQQVLHMWLHRKEESNEGRDEGKKRGKKDGRREREDQCQAKILKDRES